MEKNNINILSYNCNSASIHKRQYLKTLVKKYKPEFLCLQETWLLDHNMKSKLADIDDEYVSHGVSGVEIRKELLRGRPYGGCAILWQKAWSHRIKQVQTLNRRLCAVTIRMDDGTHILLICAYMPNDNMHKNNVNEEFVDTCMDIQKIIETVSHDQLVLAADWNTDLSRKTAQTQYLKQFMGFVNVKNCFSHGNAVKEDTFYAFSGNGSSCIDYYLLSESIYSNILLCNVVWEGINLSPHQPVLLTFKAKLVEKSNVPSYSHTKTEQDKTVPRHAWCRANKEHIEQYQRNLDKEIKKIVIPDELLKCDKINCDEESHKYLIDTLADDIIQSCLCASKFAIPERKSKNGVPKWNDLAKPAYDDAMFWHSIWLSCQRPNKGIVFEIRRKTRAKYHKIVKDLKKNDSIHRCEKMAEAILCNSTRDFWAEAKRFKPNKRGLPDTIDGIRGDKNIADYFGDKYKNLYNSVPCELEPMEHIRNMVDQRLNCTQSETFTTVSIRDIDDAISNLKPGKYDGSYGLESDHLIHGNKSLNQVLSILIGFSLKHSHMAECISMSNIVSIPKDYRASLISSDNYRGICLCSSIVKVIDMIMLKRSGDKLQTSGLQFAYKPGMSTTMSTTIVKEVASYYNSNGSPVYACLLDASKAFDRIRYDKLFQTLLDRKFPPVYIKLLMDCYMNQKIQVKWGCDRSTPFKGQNGVRQGGVISPILFTVYIDSLVSLLKKGKAGCRIGHHFYGCIIYADDIILLCPSVTGLQKMVDICSEFGLNYAITFNGKKSKCIMFGSNEIDTPEIILNGETLIWEETAMHVGNVLNRNLDDEDDVREKQFAFFNQVNVLCADFQGVNCDILGELFGKYCSSFYGSQSWDLRSKYVHSLYKAWNRGVRRTLSLPYDTHCFYLPLLLKVPSLEVQLMSRFLKMCNTMCHSQVECVSFIFRFCMNRANSLMKRNLYYISEMYGLNVNNVLELGRQTIRATKVNEEHQRLTEFLRELLQVRDGIAVIDGISKNDITVMIESVCSM